MGATHLKSATISSFQTNTIHYCLPAIQHVTSLRLWGFDLHNLEDQLSLRDNIEAFKQLTYLELDLDNVDSIINPSVHIVLPILQTLLVNSRKACVVSSLVHSIRAPSLN